MPTPVAKGKSTSLSLFLYVLRARWPAQPGGVLISRWLIWVSLVGAE